MELSQDEVIKSIKHTLPDIDFDPNMTPNSLSFAETMLRPTFPLDVIVLDYKLVELLQDPEVSHSHKVAALVFLAVSLGHELAHVLEFRCIRQGRLRADGQPYDSPPGVTCREAGAAWEIRAFGGRVHPFCKLENSLSLIRGLCIKSTAWDFAEMKMDEGWLVGLFRELHWETSPNPLRPPTTKYARYAIMEDELLGERQESPSKRKLKLRQRDVLVETGSPRKKRRPMGTFNWCGGKKVQL